MVDCKTKLNTQNDHREQGSVSITFLRQLRQKRLNAMDQTHTTTALKERKRRWHLRAVDRGAIQVLKQ